MDNTIRNEDSIFAFKTTKGQPNYEFTHDFILPDMYADLKKILYYTASVGTAGGYPEKDKISDKITYDGTVFVKIMFCDESGELGNLTYDLPYSFEVRLPECEGVLRYADKVELCSLGVKAVNPRKINVRASLSPRLCVFDEIETRLSGKKVPKNVEKLMQSVNTMEICSFIERDISISEDVVIDKSMPVIDRLAFINVTPQVSDARCDGARIYIKGYTDVEMIYISAAEPYYYCKRIMFEKSIEAKGLDMGATLFAYIRVCKTGACVTEDETGEARTVEIDFIAEAGAVCVMNVENCYVSDAYAVGQNSTLTRRELRFAELERPKTFTQNRRVMLSTADAPVAFFTRTKCAEADGTTQITVDIYAIMKNAENGYSVQTLSDSMFVDFPFDSDAYFGYFDISVSDKSIRPENGSVYLCYNVSGRSIVYKNDSVNCVCDIETGERETKGGAGLILYYPEENESDWDIAKKFKVAYNDFVSANANTQNQRAVLITKK